MTLQVNDLKSIANRRIRSASSSLTKFVLIFEDGEGLELEAGGSTVHIEARVLPAHELQEQTEAVCKVDWSWIVSSDIKAVSLSSASVVFQLQPAGDLTIGAQMWQGSAFLSFMPWRPAK